MVTVGVAGRSTKDCACNGDFSWSNDWDGGWLKSQRPEIRYRTQPTPQAVDDSQFKTVVISENAHSSFLLLAGKR